MDILARWRASHRAFHHLLASGTPDASVVERPDGVLALRTPARPERSLVNGVVYTDAAALPAALAELAPWYEAAGIQAWTVWVHPDDGEAAEACHEAGNALDATPELMWAPLDDFDLDGGGALPEGAELDEAPPWSVIGDVNDAAYGLPPDHLAAVMRGADPGLAHRAAAVVDGRPVAVAVVNRVGEDAHVLMVATLKDFRGRGLASACMRSGLRRAAADGATTTTLEATGVGAPVYARMGYRPLGALQMWERRVS